MFVQYSFVQRRASPDMAPWQTREMTPAIAMSVGVVFMAVTSVLFLLGN